MGCPTQPANAQALAHARRCVAAPACKFGANSQRAGLSGTFCDGGGPPSNDNLGTGESAGGPEFPYIRLPRGGSSAGPGMIASESYPRGEPGVQNSVSRGEVNMRRRTFQEVSWRILIGLSSLVLLAPTSPDDRPITDPGSIVSGTNSGAAPVPIPELYYTRSTFGPAWSPDGREVVFTTNMTGRFNLWKVPATGGWPIQLLESEDRQSGAVWSPDGKWIVFEQDFGGGELYDLFAVPSDGGELINHTNTPEVSESDAHWSPDGSMLAMSYRPKSSSTSDVALLDWKTRRVRKLTDEQTKNREWYESIWSADGKNLYANRANAGFTDSDVYRI